MTAETHSRAEILNEKNRVDAALKSVRQEIAAARRAAKTEGRYMNAEAFAALEVKRNRLSTKSQILQLELTRKKAMTTQPEGIAEHFLEVCREELTDKDMAELLELAQKRAAQRLAQ